MATTSPVRTFITAAVCLFVAVSITVTVAAQAQPRVFTSEGESPGRQTQPLVGAVKPLDEVESGSVDLAGLHLQGANLEAVHWPFCGLRGTWIVR